MAKPLTKTRRVYVEAEAYALSQQGWSQRHIADHLKVDQATVSRCLTRVRERVLGDLDDVAKQALFTLLGQLEHAADEAMQAWVRSKSPRRRVTRRSGNSPGRAAADGQSASATTSTDTTELLEREGEPAFLTAYYQAADRIRQLLALDSRLRPRAADDSGVVPTVRDVLLEAEAADAAYVPFVVADGSTP